MTPALLLAAALSCPAAVVPAGADWQRFSVITSAGPAEPAPDAFQRLKRLVWVEHRIAKGEYGADQLARKYGTTAMSLQTTNNDELYGLSPGRKVLVHNKNGLLYEVRKSTETLNEIVAKYHRDPRAALRFKDLVISVNKLPGSALLGDYEFEKGARVLLPKVTMTFDTYHYPVIGVRISSRFGSRYHPLLKRRRFHDGLDLARPWGSPVFPARTGQVIDAGWHEGYGMVIVIRHSDGATTRYGHLSKMLVQTGDVVQRGRTMIGRVGSTGLSTGPHLHFEVRDRNGRPLNPNSKIGRR